MDEPMTEAELDEIEEDDRRDNHRNISDLCDLDLWAKRAVRLVAEVRRYRQAFADVSFDRMLRCQVRGCDAQGSVLVPLAEPVLLCQRHHESEEDRLELRNGRVVLRRR